MPLARSCVVPAAALEFSASYPGHQVAILEGAYDVLLEALRRGRADLLVGALRQPLPQSDVVQQHLFDDTLAIIVRTGHPLNGGVAPVAGELARYPWIVPRQGSPLRRQFEQLFQSARVALPGVSIECNSLVAARELLLDSDFITLLSARQVRREVEAGMLVAMPHPDGRVTRPIGLTLRRDWRPTAAQQALVQVLRRHATAA
jgi:DNA-binding transcriptional LysR family regulator